MTENDKCDALDELVANNGHSPIGFALDGFPIYGPVGRVSSDASSVLLRSSYTGDVDSDGTSNDNPSYVEDSGDLDQCNGIFSPTPEYPDGIYHYIMTVEVNDDGTVNEAYNSALDTTFVTYWIRTMLLLLTG